MDGVLTSHDSDIASHSSKKIIPLKRSTSFDSDDEGPIDDVDGIHGKDTTKRLAEGHSKHNVILSRFRQTLSLQDKLGELGSTTTATNKGEGEGADNDTVHPLTGIPQPAKVSDSEFLHHYTHKELSDSTAWLNTTRITYDSSMIRPFSDYESLLSPRLLENIQRNFSSSTFPIQTSLLDTLLPVLTHTYRLTKHNFTRRIGDILVNAATGSGKTLAYTIPIVQILSDRTVNRLRCLVIVPTRPLIHQVFETFDKLTKGTSLIVMTSKYEVSLAEEHRKLQAVEPDIFITAPGRLVDHLQMNSFSLKNLKFLVLDEADRLLNQSFQNWCGILINRLDSDKNKSKQQQQQGKNGSTTTANSRGNVIKMVFSATLTTNTQKLHELQLFNPKLFLTDSVKLYSLPTGLQEININVPTAKSLYKPLLLLHIAKLPIGDFKGHSNNKLLVFVKSNEASIRLAALLSAFLDEMSRKQSSGYGSSNISIESINSNNSKAANRKILANFAGPRDNTSPVSDNIDILITTDLMSRGIDIQNVTSVINYDPPVSSQQYVHRCGRTARANATGLAFNMLVGKGERKYWEQKIDCDISRSVSPGSFGNVTGSEGEMAGVKTLEGEELATVIGVSEEEEDAYKKCLAELRDGTRKQANNEGKRK